MALTNLGTQLFSTVGGLVGGYALDLFGSPITFDVEPSTTVRYGSVGIWIA